MDEEDVLTNRQLGFELKAANNMIRRKMEVIFAQQDSHELNGMQGPLLGYLYHKSRNGDVYQKDVEREFRIRRSTATVMLQSLEQKGYLVRVASTEDARLKRILLTEKAIRHHDLIEEQIRNFNRELEAGLTEEEKETFLRILDKMMQNLGMDGERDVNGCSQQADHRVFIRAEKAETAKKQPRNKKRSSKEITGKLHRTNKKKSRKEISYD